MTNVQPLHCTYCDSISDWSAEHTERTEIGEEHDCPQCGSTTSIWDDQEAQSLDEGSLPQFAVPAPIY